MIQSIRWGRLSLAGAVLGACVVVAGCSSSAATTQATQAAVQSAPDAEPPEADQHRHRNHGGFAMLIALSLKDLDLSADQRATVEKIRTDLHAKMEPARAAGKELMDSLADGVAAGTIDRAKADAGIAKVSAAAEALQDATADSLNQLHAALKPEQRAALIDKIQGRFEGWKEAHGKDEQEDHRQDRHGHLGAMTKRLDLTKEQEEKIRSNFREEMKAGPQEHEHKEVHEHMTNFGTAFKSETFDAKTLGGGKRANGHMAQWGETRLARFLEAAAPVLTPDQRTKLAESLRGHGKHKES